MNDEICCITNNGKMASDDPSFLWTLYSLCKKIRTLTCLNKDTSVLLKFNKSVS